MMKLMQTTSNNAQQKNQNPELQILQSQSTHVKEKSGIPQDITDFIHKLELITSEEKVEVFTLFMKQLGLYNLFQFQTN